ncbi:MAG TPA: hypothetical protein VGJ79_14410, partial [Candidatus Dormibacteraeota bacterium]
MLRNTDKPDRTYRLVAFALALLLVCMTQADEARAQQPHGTTYADVNEDPDQGQPQADAQEPRGSLFPALEFPWDAKLDAFRKRIYDQYGLTFGASYQQLFQWASSTSPVAKNDTALGAWAA